MSEETIVRFIAGIADALRPSGHLFLWIDKYHLCRGVGPWVAEVDLEIVDLITWNKGRMGMGYRTRRVAEYLLVLQKHPQVAEGVWRKDDVPDVWREPVARMGAVHPKPVGLQAAVIEAVTDLGDIVLDPAAGSYWYWRRRSGWEGGFWVATWSTRPDGGNRLGQPASAAL